MPRLTPYHLRYILKKLAAMLFSLLILSVILFAMIRVIPGDPAILIAGESASPEEVENIRESLGLNHSIITQYALWLWRICHGDFGVSIMTNSEIAPLILSHFAVTAQIVSMAFILAAMIAIPAGMVAARFKDQWPDRIIVALSVTFLSIPSFWSGLLLILVFASYLGWFPAIGFVPFYDNPLEWARHLVLPVTTLICVEAAILTRLMRASAITVQAQDYISYARAKGLPEQYIWSRHILKNALSPVLTMMGLILGSLLGGTVLIETIFGIAGMGRLLVDAVFARDYPLIQAVLLFIVVIYMAVNFTVDLLYPLLDPRMERQSS